MTAAVSQITEERDRYRDLLYGRLIREAATENITKFGGRLAFLKPLVEEQLSVREQAGSFAIVVIDGATCHERPGVSIADLLAEMRASEDFAVAFSHEVNTQAKLANNPWAAEHENVTQQAQLLRRNPGLAARMRREAGVA